MLRLYNHTNKKTTPYNIAVVGGGFTRTAL